MAESPFHLLTIEGIVEEASALHRTVTEADVRRWTELGLLPFVGEEHAPTFPLSALALLCDVLDTADGDVARIQRRADLYAAAAAGLGPAYEEAYQELRAHISERAVLGELHRMLPVLEAAALATLRGDARLEWRMRQALRELSRRLAGQGATRSGSFAVVEPASPAEQISDAPRPAALATPSNDDAAPHRVPGLTPPPTVAASDVPHGAPGRPALDDDVADSEDSEQTLPVPRDPSVVATAEAIDAPDAAPVPDAAPAPVEPAPAPAPEPALAPAPAPAPEPAPAPRPTSPQQEFSALRAAVQDARRRMAASHAGTGANARTPADEVMDARRGQTEVAPPRVTGSPAAVSGVFAAADVGFADEVSNELPKVPALRQAEVTDERSEAAHESTLRRPSTTSRWQSQGDGRSNAPRADQLDDPVSVPRLQRQTGRERSVGQRLVEPTNPYRSVESSTPSLSSARTASGPPSTQHAPPRPRREALTVPGELPAARSRGTGGCASPGAPRAGETVPAEIQPSDDDEDPSRPWELSSEELIASWEFEVEAPAPPTRRAGETDAAPVDDIRETSPIAPVLGEDPVLARAVDRAADRAAQSDLLVTVAGADREAARRAFDQLAPMLREEGRHDELLGALLLMAEMEPQPSIAEPYLLEAADIAGTALGDQRQAFEILADVVRANPAQRDAFDRAEAMAEAFGLWAPWFDVLEAVVRSSSDLASVASLALAAARVAREQLHDEHRAIELYERLVDAGVLDPEAVRVLSRVYRDRGEHRKALELLMSLATDGERGPDEVALRSAAEVAASDLSDVDEAMAIYEQALVMGGASGALRDDYVALARRAGRTQRGIDFLASSATGEPVDRALEKAHIALDEFDAPDAAISALQAALPDVGERRVEIVRELVRIELRFGDPARAEANVRSMLARATQPLARAELTLLLDDVAGERETPAETRAAALSELVEGGVDDVRVMERLGALWTDAGRWEAALDLFALAADRSVERPDEQREWLRRAAWIAADRIPDDDTALTFLEEAVTASSGDAEVLYAMAIRCRASNDRLSEMAALERIVAQGDVRALPPIEVARLAELQVARPRGASRSAELLEMLLEVEDLDAETRDAVDRLLPRIAESSGRHDLHLRWLQRQVDGAASPAEAVVLWKLIVELQERAGVPEGERVHAVEASLRAAEASGVSERERAPLHLRAARARAALAQWDPAYAHATRAASLYLAQAPGGTQTYRALSILDRVARDVRDDQGAFDLLGRGAEAGGARERLLFARAAVRTERWDAAIPALESLLDRGDELTDEEMAEVREDLARAYRRAPRT